MSDNPTTDPELRKAIRQASRRLEQKSEAERRTLIQQAVEQAMAEELAEKRASAERDAAVIRDELARDSPQEEAIRARRTAPSVILLLLLLLLILWLIAAATGRTDLLPFSGAQPTATLGPQFQGEGQVSVANNQGKADMPGIGSLNQPTPAVGAHFQAYYDQHGGEGVFGRPISPELQVNGRTFQWFERARLEDWPEYAGTAYAVQGGRLGVEFTKGITFPTQDYFVSRPGLRYFPETRHGVADRFLQYWEQVGGLDILGFPISEQVQEMLPDKQVYTVQYFERGRIEHHPQLAGTPFEMQMGLLGRGLYLNESKPSIIAPVRPTVVPLPAAVR
jgi:hypothetical protein